MLRVRRYGYQCGDADADDAAYSHGLIRELEKQSIEVHNSRRRLDRLTLTLTLKP